MKLTKYHIHFDKSFSKKFTILFSVILFLSTLTAYSVYIAMSYRVANAVFDSIRNHVLIGDSRSVFQSLGASVRFFDYISASSLDQSLKVNIGNLDSFLIYKIKFEEPQGRFFITFGVNPLAKYTIFFLCIIAFSFFLSFVFTYQWCLLELSREAQLEKFYKLSSLAQVSAKVAHDIRSPLTTIGIVSKTLSPHNMDEAIDLINLAYGRLDVLTTELFSSAKSALEDYKLPKTSPAHVLDLSSFINALQSLQKEKIIEHALESWQVKISFDANTRQSYRADSKELIRIISNMLNNSIEARNSSSQERFIVKINLYSTMESLKIEILDNGIGIPSERLKELGTPGFSLKPLTSLSGNGLALFFAKKYLNEIDARLDIDSHYGSGTKITLTLSQLLP